MTVAEDSDLEDDSSTVYDDEPRTPDEEIVTMKIGCAQGRYQATVEDCTDSELDNLKSLSTDEDFCRTGVLSPVYSDRSVFSQERRSCPSHQSTLRDHSLSPQPDSLRPRQSVRFSNRGPPMVRRGSSFSKSEPQVPRSHVITKDDDDQGDCRQSDMGWGKLFHDGSEPTDKLKMMLLAIATHIVRETSLHSPSKDGYSL